MSIDSLLSTGYILVGIGISLAVIGSLLSLFTKTGPGTDPEIAKKNPLVRLSIGIIFSGGFCIAIAVILFVSSGVWWLFRDVIHIESPGQLAIYCLILGPSPLVFPLIAEIVSRALGGNIGAHGRSRCVLWGINIGPLLENMLMAYLLFYVTGGLAVLGLFGSGVWALIRAVG
jgi:hypothetical protein